MQILINRARACFHAAEANSSIACLCESDAGYHSAQISAHMMNNKSVSFTKANRQIGHEIDIFYYVFMHSSEALSSTSGNLYQLWSSNKVKSLVHLLVPN